MYQFSCGTAYGAHGNSMTSADDEGSLTTGTADYMKAVLAANNAGTPEKAPHKSAPGSTLPAGEGVDIAFFIVGLFGFLLLCIGTCFIVSWFSLLSPEKPAAAPVPLCQPVSYGSPTAAVQSAAPVASYDPGANIPGGIAMAPVAALQYGQPFSISTGAALAPTAAMPYYPAAPVANAAGRPASAAYGQPEAVQPALQAGPVALAPIASKPPMQVAPMQVVPVNAVPMQAAPARAIHAVPVHAIPMQAVPVRGATVQTAPVRTLSAGHPKIMPMPAYVAPIRRIVSPSVAYPSMTSRTGYDAMGRVHTNAYR